MVYYTPAEGFAAIKSLYQLTERDFMVGLVPGCPLSLLSMTFFRPTEDASLEIPATFCQTHFEQTLVKSDRHLFLKSSAEIQVEKARKAQVFFNRTLLQSVHKHHNSRSDTELREHTVNLHVSTLSQKLDP